MGINRRHGENVYYDRHGKMHHRRRIGSEYRHHHHHHRRWKRVLLIVLAVVFLCGAGLFTTWRVLDAVGRNALYKSAQENVPTLAKAEENEQEEPAGQEQSSKVWKMAGCVTRTRSMSTTIRS